MNSYTGKFTFYALEHTKQMAESVSLIVNENPQSSSFLVTAETLMHSRSERLIESNVIVTKICTLCDYVESNRDNLRSPKEKEVGYWPMMERELLSSCEWIKSGAFAQRLSLLDKEALVALQALTQNVLGASLSDIAKECEESLNVNN